MVTMTLTWDEVRAKEAQRTEARRIRRAMVSAAHTPPEQVCDICEGSLASDAVAEAACVCETRRAELSSRLARIIAEKRDPGQRRLADVIAP